MFTDGFYKQFAGTSVIRRLRITDYPDKEPSVFRWLLNLVYEGFFTIYPPTALFGNYTRENIPLHQSLQSSQTLEPLYP